MAKKIWGYMSMPCLLMIVICVLILAAARPAGAAFEKELVLENGLKVILAPQAGNPMVSVRLVVKSGSGAERDRSEFGLAHLMEHMAFKSTNSGREEGQIAWEVESAGGSIGAYTWLDETVYHLSLPSESSEIAFDVLSDMIFQPAYDLDEFEREKEVVVEEIKKYEDLPGDILADNLYGLVFSSASYGHPIIGYEDTVRGATKEKVNLFMGRHYRPDNMLLIVSGGFKSETVRPLIGKYFGTIEHHALPADNVGKQSKAPLGPRIKISLNSKTDLALAEIGFRAFAGTDSDSVPAEILAAVLSLTQASRLDEKVKSQAALVTSVSCQSSAFREDGIFTIYLETEADKLAQAIAAVLTELERLVENPPDDDELRRVKAMAAVYFLAGQESSESLGRVIGEFENFCGDWRLKDARVPQWDRVGPEDLLRIAGEIFRPDNLFVSVVLPQEAQDKAGDLEKSILQCASSFKLSSGLDVESLDFKSFEKIESWPGGPRIVVLPDKSLPFITIKAGVLGGLLAENKDIEGIASFAAEIWPLAAGQLRRPDLLRKAERLGAYFNAAAGRNTFFITVRLPAKNKDEGLALLAEIIKTPLFTNEDIEEARQDRLADLRQQEEDPAAKVALIARRAFYGPAHPYGFNSLGHKDTVLSFTPEKLKSYYSNLITPENMVFSAAGDLDAQWLVDNLKMLLADWPVNGQGRKLDSPPELAKRRSPEIVTSIMDRAQTHLRISFSVPGIGHPDRAALEVLSDYLGGGMGGPLFMELREKRSLAYDLYAHYLPGLDCGEFIFYIATDPAKSGEAFEGLKDIIAQSRELSLAPDEFEGAKLLTLGKRKRAEETMADRAESAMLSLLYDLGLDFEPKYQEAIRDVSQDELRRVAEKYFLMSQAVVAAVGPAESLRLIDMR